MEEPDFLEMLTICQNLCRSKCKCKCKYINTKQIVSKNKMLMTFQNPCLNIGYDELKWLIICYHLFGNIIDVLRTFAFQPLGYSTCILAYSTPRHMYSGGNSFSGLVNVEKEGACVRAHIPGFVFRTSSITLIMFFL
jgi:hypothetical protein